MLQNADPLSWWYPGFGEVEIVNRLHPEIRRFFADAVADDRTFLDEYLIPALSSIDPEAQILEDLSYVLADLEMEEAGLGGLGDLGKLKIKKKLKKAVKKVGTTIKKVAKSSAGQAIAAPFTMGLSVKGVREGIKTGMASKYAAPVIGVVGAVAAPFTGGASLAAASAILAANQMRQAKKAAEAAKKMAKADAASQAAEAQQAEDQTSSQVDQFYAQNQAWFVARGVDQARWNSMTLDQKVATIDAAAKGQLQVVQQPSAGPSLPQGLPEGGAVPTYQAPPSASAYQGAGFAPTAGGGGGGGGGGAPFMEPVGAEPSKIAKAGMFGGPLPIIMAAGALVYILFGQKGHGRGRGRKTRRNPSRSSQWIAAA